MMSLSERDRIRTCDRLLRRQKKAIIIQLKYSILNDFKLKCLKIV